MACASSGEHVYRLRSANNARLTFRLRAYCPVGRSHPKAVQLASDTLGVGTSLTPTTVLTAGLRRACVWRRWRWGLTLGPTTAGGGRSAVLATVTPPTRLRRGRDAGGAAESPAGSGGAITRLAAFARFAPRSFVLDLSDQVSAHLRECMIKVALVGGGHEVSPSR
jgi:hypothetical protein